MSMRIRGIAIIVVALVLGVATASCGAPAGGQQQVSPTSMFSSVVADQLSASDLHVMRFASASNPNIRDDQAQVAFDSAKAWPANVTQVERVVTDRSAALAATGSKDAVTDATGIVVAYKLVGRFILRGISQPAGSKPIAGKFAYIIVDPATSQGLDVSAGNADYDLAQAGQVAVIFPRS